MESRRKLLGISRDQVLESITMQQAVDGKVKERNGLSHQMILKVEKARTMQQSVIKNALAGMSNWTEGAKYSFYKRNPNLLCTNAGMLMMREKTTMETIAQMKDAGKISLL